MALSPNSLGFLSYFSLNPILLFYSSQFFHIPRVALLPVSALGWVAHCGGTDAVDAIVAGPAGVCWAR